MINAENNASFRTIVTSENNNAVYSADDKGYIYHIDNDGKVDYQTQIVNSNGVFINNIVTDAGMDYIFGVDSTNHIHTLKDNPETKSFDIISSSQEAITVLKVLSDDNYIYFFKKSGTEVVLDKYEKGAFDSATFPTTTDAVFSGKLYETSYTPRTKKLTLSTTSEPSPLGYGIDGDYIVIFCSTGRVYKIKSDFVAFEKVNNYMKQAAIDAGSSDVKLSYTVNDPDFLDDYFVFNSNLDNICGADFNNKEHVYYVLDSYGHFYVWETSNISFDYGDTRGNLNVSGELANANGSLKDTLQFTLSYESGHGPISMSNKTIAMTTPPMIVNEANDLCLIFFTSSNRAVAVNIEGKTAKISKDNSLYYNIRSATFTETGLLLVIYSDVNNTSFTLVNNTSYFNMNLSALRIVIFVGIFVFAIASVILFLCTFVNKFDVKTKNVFKDFVKQKWVYLIILFSLALLILFCYYPAISSIVLSFTNYSNANPSKQWNNFQNYIEIFTSPTSLASFKTMFIFLFTDIILAIVPPLIFAFFLSIVRNKTYSKVARILLFLPGILPGMATMLIWKFGIFGSSGALNGLVKLFGGQPIDFLFSEKWSLPSLIFMGFPYVGSYLIFYGAMMNIPASYFEASEIEGYSVLRRVVKVDMPLIMSQIKYVFVLSFIASIQNFGRVFTTTDGAYGTEIPINLMYRELLAQNYGMASAYAAILFLFLLVATIFNLRMQTVERD